MLVRFQKTHSSDLRFFASASTITGWWDQSSALRSRRSEPNLARSGVCEKQQTYRTTDAEIRALRRPGTRLPHQRLMPVTQKRLPVTGAGGNAIESLSQEEKTMTIRATRASFPRMIEQFLRQRVAEALPPRELERLSAYLYSLIVSRQLPPRRGKAAFTTEPNASLEKAEPTLTRLTPASINSAVLK